MASKHVKFWLQSQHLSGCFFWMNQKLPLAPLQNVLLLFLPALIVSQIASPFLCPLVSWYDTVWDFSPGCNSFPLRCIQTACCSHILSLRYSTVIGLPSSHCVRVTLICDREPQLTRITARALVHCVVFSTPTTVLELALG